MLRERLLALEDIVGHQNDALRRVEDDQEFTQRLLMERLPPESESAKEPPTT